MLAGAAATDETTGAEDTGSLAKACDLSKLQRSAKHTFILYAWWLWYIGVD